MSIWIIMTLNAKVMTIKKDELPKTPSHGEVCYPFIGREGIHWNELLQRIAQVHPFTHPHHQHFINFIQYTPTTISHLSNNLYDLHSCIVLKFSLKTTSPIIYLFLFYFQLRNLFIFLLW